MIIERRAYTLRPGRSGDFWKAQTDWNLAETFSGLLSRNVSYFHTVAGVQGQIVHLYEFESLQEWEAVYADVYSRHPREYFVRARELILSQENALYRPAPVTELSLGSRGLIAPEGVRDPTEVTVTETTLAFLPSGLPVYWAAYEQYCQESDGLARSHLIGAYFVIVGELHVVREYRWFDDVTAAAQFGDQRAATPAYCRFVDAYSAQVTASRTAYLKLAPLASHRALFEL